MRDSDRELRVTVGAHLLASLRLDPATMETFRTVRFEDGDTLTFKCPVTVTEPDGKVSAGEATVTLPAPLARHFHRLVYSGAGSSSPDLAALAAPFIDQLRNFNDKTR